MKKTIKELQVKMLTLEQANAVRLTIVSHMTKALDWAGANSDALAMTAMSVAKEIVMEVQRNLLVGASFEKAVKNSKPTKKAVKKVVKLPKRFGTMRKTK